MQLSVEVGLIPGGNPLPRGQRIVSRQTLASQDTAQVTLSAREFARLALKAAPNSSTENSFMLIFNLASSAILIVYGIWGVSPPPKNPCQSTVISLKGTPNDCTNVPSTSATKSSRALPFTGLSATLKASVALALGTSAVVTFSISNPSSLPFVM
jgi:hypothetical protein